MPWEAADRLVQQFGVVRRDVETLIGLDEYDGLALKYFDQVTRGEEKIGKKALNWLVWFFSHSMRKIGQVDVRRIAHELLGQLHKAHKSWTPEIVPANLMRELVIAVEDGVITGKDCVSLMHSISQRLGSTGKSVIRQLVESSLDHNPSSLSDIISSLHFDAEASDDLKATCEAAIAAVPDAAEKVRKGKGGAATRIVGEVMKLSQGRADAKRAREIILEILK